MAHRAHAMTLESLGRHETALAAYDRVIELDPDHAMAMSILRAIASNLAIRVARVAHSGFCDATESIADRDRILPKPPPEPP